MSHTCNCSVSVEEVIEFIKSSHYHASEADIEIARSAMENIRIELEDTSLGNIGLIVGALLHVLSHIIEEHKKDPEKKEKMIISSKIHLN